GEREQHRQWDGQGDDQPRTQVAEEQEQDGDDEEPTLEQIIANRADHVIDQFGAVIQLDDFDAGRQRRADFVELGVESACDVVAVLTHQHEAETEDALAFAVRSGGATTDFMARLHVGHVGDVDRHAFLRRDYDVPQLFDGPRDRYALDEQLLAGEPKVAATHIEIVCLHRVGDLLKGQAVFDELLRV